jgi:hypothetical protein
MGTGHGACLVEDFHYGSHSLHWFPRNSLTLLVPFYLLRLLEIDEEGDEDIVTESVQLFSFCCYK